MAGSRSVGIDRAANREAASALLFLAVLSAMALLLLVALLLAARRFSGALRTPLETPVLLAVVGLTALAAVGLRAAWRQVASPPAASWIDLFARYAPSAALLIVAGSVSLKSAPLLGVAGCWALAIGEEFWHWGFRPWARRAAPARSQPPHDSQADPARRPRADVPEHGHLGDDSDVFQQLTRARDADGRDVLLGTLRADLTADQRTAVMHVAFCPPFAATPRVDFEQSAGPEARIRLGQVLPYGARLDVRLTHAPRQASRVVVAIRADDAGATRPET